MDPLSVTASLIAVIQLSTDVIKYINSATGASKERKRLREELRSCATILQQLKDEADDSEEGKAWSETVKSLEAPGAPLGRLWLSLSKIEARLCPQVGIRKTLAVIHWPFQEKEIKEIFATIEREKSLLELALVNNSRKLLQEIKRTSTENREQLACLIRALELSSDKRERQFSGLTQSITKVQDTQSILHSDLEGLNRRQDDKEQSEKRWAILTWLTQTDYATQQCDIIRSRQLGTGQWLLESVEFKSWLAAKNQTLFCPGFPGAGKTIITSVVVHDLLSRFDSDKSTGVAYLYCNFKRQHEQHAENLLLSLVKQLAQDQPTLPNCVKQLYDDHQKQRPSIDEIIRTLQAVAELYSRVFIIVDALDECKSDARKILLSAIFDLRSNREISFFATSRQILEITEHFTGCFEVEIKASEQDVRLYVEANMSKLPPIVRNKAALKEEVLTAIISAVDGMFLLAPFHIRSLAGLRKVKEVKDALLKLPSGIGAAVTVYTQAMERIEGDNDQKETAKQVLSWITRANQRLTTAELQHALAVQTGESEFDEDYIQDIDEMVRACAGLVTVDEESNIIRLVHYTTQEFFTQTWQKWFPDSELYITEVCSTYLSYDVFENGSCEEVTDLENRLKSYPLYRYAARNWGRHAQRAQTPCAETLSFLENELKVEASSQVLFLHDLKAQLDKYDIARFPKSSTGLHMAAYFGVDYAVRHFLGKSDLDQQDGDLRTPLSWASGNGHEIVVRILLENQADPQLKDSSGRTPLFYAAWKDHEGIVKLLLEDERVDIDSRDEDGDSPLCVAVEFGWQNVVGLLLATNKVNVDQRSGDASTPLSVAAREGHVAIVQLLLANGASPDLKGQDGTTPLNYAAGEGTIAHVQLLLENGASSDSKDNNGRTPLSWAAGEGHVAVVQLLLDNEASSDSKNNDGRTPLSFAAQGGHVAVVQLLLENEASSDSKDIDGRTPLSWAIEEEHVAVVQILLDNEASSDFKNNDGRTPLSFAAQVGHVAIVQLLLGNEASSDSKDNNGRTPLSYASREGHVTVVQLLLAQIVDVNSKDEEGRTPLSHAAEKGHITIIELLLAESAVVESRDNNGRTPLSYTAANEHVAVVRLLLAKEAFVNSEDTGGRTTLSWAASQGGKASVDIIQMLLKNKASVNLADSGGRTPLQWAVMRGNPAAVKRLLKRRADIHCKDSDDRTLLSWAANSPYESVIQLLVDKGADLDSEDEDGNKPSDWIRMSSGENIILQLFQEGIVVGLKDLQYRSGQLHPFVKAANWRRNTILKFLDLGLDINSRDKNGRTPLAWATRTRHKKLLDWARERAKARTH